MGAIDERAYLDTSDEDLARMLGQMPKGDRRRLAILYEIEQRDIKQYLRGAELLAARLVILTKYLAWLTFGLLLISIVTLAIIFQEYSDTHPKTVQTGKP